MSKTIDPAIVAAFQAGRTAEEGTPAPHLFSSTMWEAWKVGEFFRENSLDSDAEMIGASRSTYRVDSFSGTFAYTVRYLGKGAWEITYREC